jgi:hypothetical protein
MSPPEGFRVIGCLFLAALAAGCTERSSPASVTMTTAAEGADTRLTLVPAPGFKVNARIKPALELEGDENGNADADGYGGGGVILRFDSPGISPDSAYFTQPPTALLAGRHRKVRGILRASVCGVHEGVCRSVTMAL